jgi:hypothetical protein
MVASDKKTQKRNRIKRIKETGPSRNSFSEIKRHEGIGYTKTRYNYNINLRVSKKPKHMLKEDSISTTRIIKKRSFSLSIGN